MLNVSSSPSDRERSSNGSVFAFALERGDGRARLIPCRMRFGRLFSAPQI